MVDDERRWSFRSDSVRDVVYSTLTKASRAQRHVGVATAIAEGIEQDPELVETMAHHLATAAELVADLGPVKGVPDDLVERAASALAGAARRARTLDNSRVAGQLADRALQLAGGHTDAGRAKLSVVRAWAAMTRGDLDASRADAADALVIAKSAKTRLRWRACTPSKARSSSATGTWRSRPPRSPAPSSSGRPSATGRARPRPVACWA